MPQTPVVPIMGGGPAGMSCALWLRNYGLRPIIIEQAPALGGMARRSPYPNDWLLGRPGATARENAHEFTRHIEQAAVETCPGSPQRAERRADGSFGLNVTLERPPFSSFLSCPALVIATGTKFRGAEWLDGVINGRRLAERGRVHLGPPWAGEPNANLGS